MAQKKVSDTIRQQKLARQEFLKLKKIQRGELDAGPKPSEVYAAPLTFPEKIKNIWYHDKLAIIIITILTLFIAAIITQCATKTKYDATIVVFTYSITGDNNCDKMGEYLKPYCLDINDDGKVNVNVINCSFDINNGNNDFNYTNRQKAQMLLANDASALLFITDEESYKYLNNLSEKITVFEGEPIKFKDDFYKYCVDNSGFYDTPAGLQISCRNIKGSAIENDKNIDSYYKQAQTLLDELSNAYSKQ